VQPEPELEPTWDLAIFGNSDDGLGGLVNVRERQKEMAKPGEKGR
jgi:hypothetical protein